MTHQAALNSYLTMAAALDDGRLHETALPAASAALPPLTSPLLDRLVGHAQQARLAEPRRGWALMAVADAAAARGDNSFLTARAAWELARAANEWVQPERVIAAVDRAEAGFAALEQPGWLAACAWQRNAEPWTRPNFNDAAVELAAALSSLQEAGLNHLVADCRLSLAYGLLLIKEFEAAAEQIQAADQFFQDAEDRLGHGRCLLTLSSSHRRQSDFAASLVCLQEALPLFEELDSPVYVARTYHQLGYITRSLQDDFAGAENYFRQALLIFETADMLLWCAQAWQGLALVYMNFGRMTAAGEALERIRQILIHYNIPGLAGDNQLDIGLFEMYKGNYQIAFDHFVNAEKLYRAIDNPWMPSVAALNQGEASFLQGRYQQALHYLENAYARLHDVAIPYRIAHCETRLARVWARLGRPELAHHYLDKATAYFQEAEQDGALAEAYNLRAETLFKEGKEAEAVAVLRQVLAMARRHDDLVEIALSQRLLGEALCALEQPAEAAEHLQAAATNFARIGLVMEEAACQIAWGSYHRQTGDRDAARAAWEEALALSQGVMADIAWQAHAGLAALAEQEGDHPAALRAYRRAVEALARQRQDLWQPNLVDAYLSRPAPVLDAAVNLAVGREAQADSLFFIEESKAQIAAQQLGAGISERPPTSASTPLVDLAAEIRWLQEHIRAKFGAAPGWLRLPEELKLRQQLVAQVGRYDSLKSRLEREQKPGETAVATGRFAESRFRHLANGALGEGWAALDYYLAGDRLNAVLLTANDALAWSAECPASLQPVLARCTRDANGPARLSAAERLALGNWLLPELVRPYLHPDNYLVIAPHRALHRLPWPALTLGTAAQLLVTTSLPVIAPSLYSLTLLWQRTAGRDAPAGAGLLLAVSDFEGRRKALPAVVDEIKAVMAQAGAEARPLLETAATWANLRRLAGADGLERFAFLHLASHAFHDPISGRLSGIALYDRDIWLDDLWQLAPLPPVVVLSACSGSLSRMYGGDEAVGLVTTCLAAGAQAVLGSLWSIPDAAAADLMPPFYAHFLAGTDVARSLALAQREALQAGVDVVNWGGFLCTGFSPSKKIATNFTDFTN